MLRTVGRSFDFNPNIAEDSYFSWKNLEKYGISVCEGKFLIFPAGLDGVLGKFFVGLYLIILKDSVILTLIVDICKYFFEYIYSVMGLRLGLCCMCKNCFGV